MRIAGLLLAAGAGRRFGGCKQLALIDGKPLVRHALETLVSVFDEQLYIVLGAHSEDVRPVVEDIAQVIDHSDWQQGLGSSIACGVREIVALEQFDGILVSLADQLRLTPGDFDQLIEQFHGDRTVAAYYADSPGVPAIFPVTMFEQLKQLGTDRGAKSLLVDMQREIVTIPMPAAAMDIDTREDLE
jgi:molybdenum cofactor cytidylyltransferase